MAQEYESKMLQQAFKVAALNKRARNWGSPTQTMQAIDNNKRSQTNCEMFSLPFPLSAREEDHQSTVATK